MPKPPSASSKGLTFVAAAAGAGVALKALAKLRAQKQARQVAGTPGQPPAAATAYRSPAFLGPEAAAFNPGGWGRDNFLFPTPLNPLVEPLPSARALQSTDAAYRERAQAQESVAQQAKPSPLSALSALLAAGPKPAGEPEE